MCLNLPVLCLSTYYTYRMYRLHETMCVLMVDLCSPGKEVVVCAGRESQVE